MREKRTIPIRSKLILIVLTISTAATLASCLFYGAYDWVANRRTMVDNLTTLADVLGNNSTAALTFQDKTTAEDLLKGLRAHPQVEAASLLLKDDTPLAAYATPGMAAPLHTHRLSSPVFTRNHLIVCRPVVLDNKLIGTVHIQASLDPLYDRLKIYASVAGMILLASGLITIILATIFNRLITTPILNLAGVMRRVSDNRDYSVRAIRTSQDETGELTDGFNRMLHGIETRDNALRQGNEALHKEIAERRKAEEAMRLLNETLEQRVSERTAAAEAASRTKSEFLANVSHELRTPLNSIIGFANLLLKNKFSNLRPEDLAYLERIQANGRHLLSLINQVLDLSKIEARKTELDITPVDLPTMIRNVIAETEAHVYGRPVRLMLDAPPTVAPLRTDAGKLRQVLINLIGNGVKFTEQGHVLVTIVTEPSTGYPIRIDVNDTGIGIPAEKQSVIFEAFKQADSTTARRYGGTGLGLTISLALCQLMGYRLDVCSEEGRGSTFSIFLAPEDLSAIPFQPPAPRAQAVPALAGPDGAYDPLPGRVVLVVDDEEDALLMLTRMIEDFGCIVLPASSGEEAIRLARKTRPDAITLDLLMPRMDGWEVLRTLKTDPALHTIPVIVVSVVADQQQGAIIGAIDMLQKPVSREDLQRVLKTTQRAKVLIVDDSEDDRRLVSACLAGDAIEISMASSGQEALDILNARKPDLVILDLMMPGMNGETLLRMIRDTKEHSSLPVVVLTAKELTLAERRRLAGMTSAVLQKGANLDLELRAILASVMQNDRRAHHQG